MIDPAGTGERRRYQAHACSLSRSLPLFLTPSHLREDALALTHARQRASIVLDTEKLRF